jgi:CheY-like chemotaxis protein
MKVLAVEDDKVALAILRRSLERLGHDVIEAHDGEEAWEAWLREKPRVAVSDWQMPRLDGLKLCKRFRAQEGQDYVYFILLTGTGGSPPTAAPRRRRASTTS